MVGVDVATARVDGGVIRWIDHERSDDVRIVGDPGRRTAELCPTVAGVGTLVDLAVLHRVDRGGIRGA